MADPRPGDPADRAADGAFGGVHSHRAGYGDDKLARLVDYLRQRPSATLASGEGALLLAEIDQLRDDLHTQDGWVQWAKGEMERLRNQLHLADQSARSSSAEAARLGRILAALREPSSNVIESANVAFPFAAPMIPAAVAAAEQEVGRE